jgi:hypothetical protein
MSLRSLLERRSKEATFPKLRRLSKLSRDFSFAGATVDETEVILRKQILIKKAQQVTPSRRF